MWAVDGGEFLPLLSKLLSFIVGPFKNERNVEVVGEPSTNIIQTKFYKQSSIKDKYFCF